MKKKNFSWEGIYKAGGAAALLAVIVFRRNFGTEVMTFNGLGIFLVPETLPVRAVDWFALFEKDPLMSLVLLDAVDLINYTLVGLIFLALYGALKDTHRRAMLFATISGFAGIVTYYLSNHALAMYSLSRKYLEAETELQRSIIASAGEVLLAKINPGSIYQSAGIYLSLFFVLLGGLVISIVLLRSDVFGKTAAVCGLLSNGINLLYFPVLAFIPAVVWLPHSLAAPFRMVWYILIAVKILQIGRKR